MDYFEEIAPFTQRDYEYLLRGKDMALKVSNRPHGFIMYQSTPTISTNEAPSPDSMSKCALCGEFIDPRFNEQWIGAFYYEQERTYHLECAARVLATLEQPAPDTDIVQEIQHVIEELQSELKDSGPIESAEDYYDQLAIEREIEELGRLQARVMDDDNV